MKCIFALAILSALGSASAAQLHSRSPVERVVNLLNELKDELDADAKAEKKIYNKFACWCETASSEKAKAIVRATEEIKKLVQKILSLKGKVAVLTSEIAEAKAEIVEIKEQQEQLTVIRGKENSAYLTETSELMQALAALQGAVTVLKKATGGSSLLQEQATARNAVQAAIQAMPMRVKLSEEQISLLSEFTSGTSVAKYSPQSLTVQGIMADMYETFSADLESLTVTESKSNKDYEETMETLDKRVATLKEVIEKKTEEKATAEVQLADTTETYDSTYAQREADTVFFDGTVAACKAKADEYNERVDLRTEELKGIKQALEVLTSDDARDLFIKTIKAGVATEKLRHTQNQESFLQLSSQNSVSSEDSVQLRAYDALKNTTNSVSSEDSVQLRAYDALKKQASKFHSVRLAQLAATVRLAKFGHFDKVIEAIDKMINALTEEGLADVDKRDECKKEYTKIKSTVADLSWKIEKNEAKISKLEALIEQRKEERLETIEEIAATDKLLEDMKKVREADHAEWELKKKEDEDAIVLLDQAIDYLYAYYKKNGIKLGPIQGNIKLLQEEPVFSISNTTAPDATFSSKDYRKGQSKDAISILTMIKEDLANEIKYATQFEEEETATYLTNKKNAEDLRAKLVEKKTQLEQMIADRNADREAEIKLKEANEKDKEAELTYKAKIKPDCDFILRTFEDRATKRAAELKGLTEAKDYLAGANPPVSAAFLEKKNAQ